MKEKGILKLSYLRILAPVPALLHYYGELLHTDESSET